MLVHMPETEPELWEGGGRRYRMEKVVGNGAFGVVWRAVEEGTTERVAIKKVRASYRPRCASLAYRQGRAPRAARSPCAVAASHRSHARLQVVLDRRYHNRELEMMKGLEHECVIKLHHHFEKPGKKRDESYLHLVMDYMPETIRSLSLQYQKERTRFPIDHVRLYLYQCLKALEYVHSKRICHRDLKPDTLLVDPSRQRLKVTSTLGVE